MSAGRDATTVKMEDLIGEEVATVFTDFEAQRGGNDGFGVGGESGTPKFSGKILRIVTEFPPPHLPRSVRARAVSVSSSTATRCCRLTVGQGQPTRLYSSLESERGHSTRQRCPTFYPFVHV
jgi:hypothetical protein